MVVVVFLAKPDVLAKEVDSPAFDKAVTDESVKALDVKSPAALISDIAADIAIVFVLLLV